MTQKIRSTWVRNTGRGGGSNWMFQRLTGLFIMIVILSHFAINHFHGSGEVSYEVVRARLSSPLYKSIEIGFLLFALWHGLSGLWVVAADYIKHHGWRTFVYATIVLGGAAIGCLGALTILSFPYN